MSKKIIIIPDQDEANATLAALKLEAFRAESAAGANFPARPTLAAGDVLFSIELLQAHIAACGVVSRLQSPQPRQTVAVSHPAPVQALSGISPATGSKSVPVAGVSNLPVKLTATDKARMAKGLPVTAKPAPMTATARCLAAKAKLATFPPNSKN